MAVEFAADKSVTEELNSKKCQYEEFAIDRLA
jgi:hypothetical protein